MKPVTIEDLEKAGYTDDKLAFSYLEKVVEHGLPEGFVILPYGSRLQREDRSFCSSCVLWELIGVGGYPGISHVYIRCHCSGGHACCPHT